MRPITRAASLTDAGRGAGAWVVVFAAAKVGAAGPLPDDVPQLASVVASSSPPAAVAKVHRVPLVAAFRRAVRNGRSRGIDAKLLTAPESDVKALQNASGAAER